MKPLNLLLSLISLGMFPGCSAQIDNARTIAVHIDGNCGMCEKTIEAAALVKGESKADWDRDTKLATITYDSIHTDLDAVLKRIALAGYDNEKYLAPDKAYAGLDGCCQYERTGRHEVVNTAGSAAAGISPTESMTQQPNEKSDHLKPVFDAYFALKDALIATNSADANLRAGELAVAVKAVQMERMSPEVHGVWMQVMDPLVQLAMEISTNKDIDKQRSAFATLSEHMHELVKVAPRDVPVYYDHCPMYGDGANWLSLEKPIKNPFFGSMMLSCGSVQETIQ